MQSGPDAFDKSRFIIIFLTILGDTEILCCFKVVQEGKSGKEIPESSRLEFLGKFLGNSFVLLDAEDNTSRLLKRGGSMTYLPLRRTLLAVCQKSREPRFWEVMGSFISICKFGSFKNPFAMITSLSELYFRSRRFVLLVQRKKVIFASYGNSTSSWKPWRWTRLGKCESFTPLKVATTVISASGKGAVGVNVGVEAAC